MVNNGYIQHGSHSLSCLCVLLMLIFRHSMTTILIGHTTVSSNFFLSHSIYKTPTYNKTVKLI